MLESIWQTLIFNLPIDPALKHMFMYEFMDGKKDIVLFTKDGKNLGGISESILDFILYIDLKEYQDLTKDIQLQIDKVVNMGKKLNDQERSSGLFRQISLPTIEDPYGGLKDGDIIEGFGMIT